MIGAEVIATAVNSPTGEHAERILIKKAPNKKLLFQCSVFSLIPPCIMCAKAIVRSGIKRVEYLFEYGDNFGKEYLRSHRIIIQRYNK